MHSDGAHGGCRQTTDLPMTLGRLPNRVPLKVGRHEFSEEGLCKVKERAKCRKVLDEMLNAGWAEPANVKCPMAAPMFFVWKKDGTRQPVIDYR
jgi:hypothetical protein